MTFAEQQRQAHIERQRRLGITPQAPAPVRPVNLVAPPLMPQPEPAVSPVQEKVIAHLLAEIARLSAKLQEEEGGDEDPLLPSPGIKSVVGAVAKYYGVPLREIVSYRRSRELVRPRHVAMYLARRLTKHSLPTIGRVLDRDHTSVLHGCRRIEKLRQEDAGLDTEIRALIAKLAPGARDE